MRRKLPVLVIALMLLFVLQPLAHAWVSTPPTPTLIYGSGGVGSIYKGATPPNVDYSKPVLVFVHGKSGQASNWWTDTVYHGKNDMYAYAYNNGYRTAFVSLYGGKDMWVNGSLLNSQIDKIRSHFGVSKVSIIAHSKGGIDANAASVHYGAAPKISRVITLNSPHWGSPLADMAYSTWTWWLAELLGQRDDATYVLQTGYMKNFRAKTDGKDPAVPYWTTAGYKCGPIFTALWYSCAAISGEDDGLVPVWSARKPGGVELKNGYWDHDEVRMGSRTWSTFSPKIQTASNSLNLGVAWEGAKLAAGSKATDAAPSKAPVTPGNLILRGGMSGEGMSFPIESQVRSVNFVFYSSSPDFTATLTGPDGATYTVATTNKMDDEQTFSGAYAGSVEVKAPAAGAWKLSSTAPGQAGYLMIASLDSDLRATLAMGQDIATPGAKQTLTAGFAPGRAIKESKVEGAVSRSGEQPHGRPAFAKGQGNTHTTTVDVPAGEAVHNVTLNVMGVTADGSAFERTLVSSFAARK